MTRLYQVIEPHTDNTIQSDDHKDSHEESSTKERGFAHFRGISVSILLTTSGTEQGQQLLDDLTT